MATPPSKGIGFAWTLRGPGRSTIPTRNARGRASEVKNNEAIKATLKEMAAL
jgi:hypothetical protein